MSSALKPPAALNFHQTHTSSFGNHKDDDLVKSLLHEPAAAAIMQRKQQTLMRGNVRKDND